MLVNKKIHWTEHSKIKMRQYGLSKTKLINLIYKPERKEEGIVPGTVAVMKTNKVFFTKKKIAIKNDFKPQKSPGEIWLMFRDTKDQRKVISAWRYPGVTKAGDQIPIPKDIAEDILNNRID
ncbi:MAG: hypothetical protein FJZ43_01125 [Candidatus Staskawiczbacteria bacterium]|nr:hypothetical protein [Candidatus Staskawiczbacteria bacterium]